MSKLLSEILSHVSVLSVNGNPEIPVRKVEFDSRKVSKGDLFVAVPGTKVDGHDFIGQAINKGAAAILYEDTDNSDPRVCWIKTKDSSVALAMVASAFYDFPSEKIKLSGITGTNGKTTVATLLYKLFKSFGYKVGLLSTVSVFIDDKIVEASHTTPDALTINRFLREMIDAGCEYAFIEVSSHAIKQNRVYDLDFDVAVFSNITHDHLDYHKTFDEYIKAKKLFFDNLSPSASALVNIDDRNGRVMIQNTEAMVSTYALKRPADFKGKVIENSFEGLLIEINGKQVWTRLSGDFNAYNLLSVYGVACLLKQYPDKVLTKLSALQAAAGRFDVIKSDDGRSAIIDYAHTPDALENVLKTIQDVRTKHQQLITIIGAGGDRDKTKRPVMAEIAVAYSDKVILTSDNPRSESPLAIIEDMKKGISKEKTHQILEITDRKQAIHTACMIANNKDIILIAGKGHETYQEIEGKRYHFDDKQIIQSIFKHHKKRV
ncbi:MAG: UDP-N-acetylmuramoyl-L-alanyl-D-glutamate--2,6-diaminopimelate ligase [Bacteroidales bacterium]|nr:UDP-N-acetylmuramoyl-L-alanyl-D-glutamate--2,6-diaminopimelate ligase [Bacteroidales bacterium]